MLRGAQTLGELRGRSERIYPFADLVETEAAMQALLQADPEPLATKLPKLPGTKEPRYAHLRAGPVEAESAATVQEEAKARGFAWHARDNGLWTWKTMEEVQDITITPLVNAAEMDGRDQP